MTAAMTPAESATLEHEPAPSPAPGRGYYKEHLGNLPQRLLEAVPSEELRGFHARSGWRHLLIAARQALLLAACTWALIRFDDPWIWIPVAAVQGTVIL